MKKFLIITFFVLFLSSCAQEEPTPNSQINDESKGATAVVETPKPVTNSDSSKTYVASITICSKEIPSDVKPYACFGNSSQVNFYTAGENFIGVNKDSLVLDRLTLDGVDISRDRNLKPNAVLGSFPKASDDGKYAKWSVEIKDGLYSQEQRLEMEGHVMATKSHKLIELSSQIVDIEDFESFRLGKVLIQGTRGPDIGLEGENLTEAELKLFEQALKKSEALGSNPTDEDVKSALADLGIEQADQDEFVDKLFDYMFLGVLSKGTREPDSNEISVTIKTDFSAFERIELYADGVEIKREGWFGSHDQRTYSFEKPAESKVMLKVFYWNDPQQVKLRFKI